MQVPLLAPPEHRWECLSCDFTDVTREVQPHSRYHACSGQKGLSIPMVPAGTRGRQYAVEREDYIGSDHVQVDGDGRPVMAVITEREDGQDCAVFAPTAVVTAEE